MCKINNFNNYVTVECELRGFWFNSECWWSACCLIWGVWKMLSICDWKTKMFSWREPLILMDLSLLSVLNPFLMCDKLSKGYK